MAQHSTFEMDLKTAETQLLKNLSTNNRDLESEKPIEDICKKLTFLVDGRRIRAFRSVFTAPKSAPMVVDHRSQEIVFLKTIKDIFKPEKCLFHATELSEDERRYLNARGIDAEAAEGVLDSSTDDFAENEVEICWVTFCNPFLLNDLIRSRWMNLSKTVFIGPVITFSSCRVFREKNPLFSHYLDTTRYKINAYITRNAVPSTQLEPLVKKDCILPFYKKKTEADEEFLEEMTEFAHIDANIRRIQREFVQDGFSASFLSKLQKLLGGRTLKRIKIIGLGNFASCFQTSTTLIAPLRQLALIRTVQKHYNASISSQEPRVTPFEMEYLNSLGIATPEADDLQSAEEGLAENEVALFFMFGCFDSLRNSVCWANRKAMRNILIVGAGNYSKSQAPKCCENCDEFGRKLLNANAALKLFYEGVDEILLSEKPPLRFRGSSLMTYPHKTLPVSDEKPTDLNDGFSDRKCLKVKRK